MKLPTFDPLTTFLGNRTLARSPIPLYRLGLGFLLGSRMLMLEHIGRTSGQRRFVALEVVEREGPNTILIASGFGETAQWYRNLAANPQCHVWTGSRRRVPATASLLSASDSATLLQNYVAAHPRMYRQLMASIASISGIPEAEVPARIRLVRLSLS